MNNETQQVSLLAIDAWHSILGGWEWNDWHKIGAYDVSVCDLTPRQLLAKLRADGYLSDYAVGRVAVEDDGYNVVIVLRGNRKPLLAIAYGEEGCACRPSAGAVQVCGAGE